MPDSSHQQTFVKAARHTLFADLKACSGLCGNGYLERLDILDAQLRESRLRKAGIAGRARMASELRDMDEDVSSLSRTLAVRTLQLEMEYIFSCLEDEALDIAQDLKGAGYLLLRCV